MAGIKKTDFSNPDETRKPENMKMDIVDLGGVKAARFTAQPGWIWSKHVAPIVGTASCANRHIGVIFSGSVHTVSDDGTELDLNAGDAYVIEPGHDAWTTSDEPAVGYEFDAGTIESYAKT